MCCWPGPTTIWPGRDRGELMSSSNLAARGFRERVGGRWAISIRGFLIAFVVALIGIFNDVDNLGHPDGTIFLVATVAVFALNGAVDVWLHRTRWSMRRVQPVPATEVFARIALSGVSIAVTYALLRTELGIAMPVGVAQGFVLYPAIAVWAGTSTIVYLDVVDQARQMRQRAVEERARSIDVVQRAEVAVEQVRERVGEVLAPELDRLRAVTSAERHDVVSDEIRAVVDRSVRSTGHELWRSADRSATRISFFEVIRGLILRPVLRPWPMIGFGIIIPLFEEGANVDAAVLVLAAVATLAVYVECSVANAWMRRWPRCRSLVAMGIVAVFVGQTLAADHLGESWGQSPDDPGVVALLVLTFCMVAVTSALGSYRDLNDERAQVIADGIDAERLDAAAHAHAVSEETRRLAGLLHGRVQSRWLGCAMAIEFAGNDPEALRAALDRTLEVLGEDWRGDMDGADPLAGVVAPWAGLAEVNLVVADDAQQMVTADVRAVVEELVANAVRHGGATRVDVDVTRDGNGCVIVVGDNGAGAASSRSGLGSILIERVGEVERVATSNGWTVRVRVPLP